MSELTDHLQAPPRAPEGRPGSIFPLLLVPTQEGGRRFHVSGQDQRSQEGGSTSSFLGGGSNLYRVPAASSGT